MERNIHRKFWWLNEAFRASNFIFSFKPGVSCASGIEHRTLHTMISHCSKRSNITQMVIGCRPIYRICEPSRDMLINLMVSSVSQLPLIVEIIVRLWRYALQNIDYIYNLEERHLLYQPTIVQNVLETISTVCYRSRLQRELLCSVSWQPTKVYPPLSLCPHYKSCYCCKISNNNNAENEYDAASFVNGRERFHIHQESIGHKKSGCTSSVTRFKFTRGY